MALDSQGRVVSYGTNRDGQQTGRFVYDVWDPSGSAGAGHSTLQNTTQTDLFCSLQLNRPDTGDMVLFGGDVWNGRSTSTVGNADINLYDAGNSTLSSLPGMNLARWYATGTTLVDGSFYIQGGKDGGERQPERWSPEGGSELLPINTSDLNWWYPRNWLTPDGRIFGVDVNGQMYAVDQGLENMTRLGSLPARPDTGSPAVMFAPGQVLYVIGSTRQAFVIDTSGPTPAVTEIARTNRHREWGNLTLLPDGKVLATGGSSTPVAASFPGSLDQISNIALEAELWDPSTRQWTLLPAASTPRLYHSTAVLLPDGRVLTGGGGAPGPLSNTNAEIYRPGYLYDAGGAAAQRPSIGSVGQSTAVAGDSLTVSVSHSRPIERLTLVKTGSATHSFDMEQRFVELTFSGSGGDLTAQLPGNPAVIPPGFYHVFALDDLGVPSVAQSLRILPAAPGATPPPPPAPETPETPGPEAPVQETTPAPTPTTDNLVVNGSFENDLTGWTVGGGQLNQSYDEASDFRRATDGRSSLPLGGWVEGIGHWTEQTVPTAAGGRYALGFDAGVNFGTETAELRVTVTAQDGSLLLDERITDTTGGGMPRYNYEFVATDASVDLRFTLTAGAGTDFDVDNVVITAANGEPPAPPGPAPTPPAAPQLAPEPVAPQPAPVTPPAAPTPAVPEPPEPEPTEQPPLVVQVTPDPGTPRNLVFNFSALSGGNGVPLVVFTAWGL